MEMTEKISISYTVKKIFKNHFLVVHVHNTLINVQKQDTVSVTEGHLPLCCKNPICFLKINLVMYMYQNMELKFLVINKQHSVHIRVKHHPCHIHPVHAFKILNFENCPRKFSWSYTINLEF